MKTITLLAIALAMTACDKNMHNTGKMPIDKSATASTVMLYNRLFKIAEQGIMVAHQDDLAYGRQRYEPGFSDVKQIAGDYPAVTGWEIGHIELGAEYSLDSVYFSDMKRLIPQTYERGGITTISWHGDNIVTGGSTWDCELDSVVSSVLKGGAKHAEYLKWLDRIADFFLELKDSKGELIPVIFRMYHEQTSSWFWWGAKQCTAEEYQKLWIMTVEHLRDTKGVHNLLYAYSPSDCTDEAAFLERYPGDQYVDIVGFDTYFFGQGDQARKHYMDNVDRNLKIITDYATKSDKIATFSETGQEGLSDTKYFTEVVYPVIRKYKIAWVLFWRNAWEADKPNHFYMPYQGHDSEPDLKEFLVKPGILMNKDIEAIK